MLIFVYVCNIHAGLFEQCRVVEPKSIHSFFSKHHVQDDTMTAAMEQTLPYCHLAHISTTTEDMMQAYLEKLDLTGRKTTLTQDEPMIQVQFQNVHDSIPKSIEINSLTPFKHLVHLASDSKTWDHEGNPPSNQEFASDNESPLLRMSIKCRGRSMSSYFLPYSANQSLAKLEIKDGDVITVYEISSDKDASVNPSLLRTVNACFDPSLLYWLADTYSNLHQHMGRHDNIVKARKQQGKDWRHQSLFREVIKFWWEDTGAHEANSIACRRRAKLNFLSADTQMVCTFSSRGSDVSYSSDCYQNAMRELMREEGEDVSNEEDFIAAMSYVISAALMEQALFTDVAKLLEQYAGNKPPEEDVHLDEGLMRSKYPFLYRAYIATKSRDTLRRYLQNLDKRDRKEQIKKSLSIKLRFFHLKNNQFHKIEVSPLVTLETLIGIHSDQTNFEYENVQITAGEEGRRICFGTDRRKTLAQLGIRNHTVFNIEDLGHRRPWQILMEKDEVSYSTIEKEFEDEFFRNIRNLVCNHVQKSLEKMLPAIRTQLGPTWSILVAIANYFTKPGKLKMLSGDELDRFEGNSLSEKLRQMAMEFEEKDSFLATTILVQAFIEQCRINGAYNVVVSFCGGQLSAQDIAKWQQTSPVIAQQCKAVEEADSLRDHLQTFDMYTHCNKLADMEPRINLVFSNRSNGVDSAMMANVNGHITFYRLVKKFATPEHRKNLHTLQVIYNNSRAHLNSCGKLSLCKLGVKDEAVVVVELPRTKPSSRDKQPKSTEKGNPKRKKKGRAKSKNKPREQIIIPTTEDELRKQHSKSLSPVLDQLEQEKLRHIRQKLNNLLIKKSSSKVRRTSTLDPKVESQPVFNQLSDGLGGKAGKVCFPVVVGNTEHLYKSSKRQKKQAHTSQIVRVIDLHGCTAGEALSRLKKEIPVLTDAAMKEESFTICADIICGGGNQILSEVVERWIRQNKHVANRPKGFIH